MKILLCMYNNNMHRNTVLCRLMRRRIKVADPRICIYARKWSMNIIMNIQQCDLHATLRTVAIATLVAAHAGAAMPTSEARMVT